MVNKKIICKFFSESQVKELMLQVTNDENLVDLILSDPYSYITKEKGDEVDDRLSINN